MRRRRWPLVGVLLAGAGVVSCGLDWTLPEDADGGGPPDVIAPGEAGGPETGRDSGGDVAPDQVATDAHGDGGKLDGAEAGAPMVCHTENDCPTGTFCHFPDHLCGMQDAGICIPPRTDCTAADPFVCACSGVSVQNECLANSTPGPVDVSIAGNCGPFPFEWICGYVYCGGTSGPPDCERTNVNGEAKYDCVTPPGCGAFNGCSGCTVPGCTCMDMDAGAFIDCGP